MTCSVVEYLKSVAGTRNIPLLTSNERYDYTLQTSLDFDKGGKIATQLFQIYEFCRKQLIKAFTKKVVVGINKAIKTLNEIITAWKEMIIKNAAS